MKYLVMECNLSYAVVLDEQGCFRKVANLNYEVGQTVTDIVEMQVPATRKQNHWLRPLGAMAACLMLAFSGYFFHYMPFASVYMAINPEVRIDVSRTDRVVKVEGVNEDGRTLVTGYEPRHQDLDLVMDELVDRAIDMNYLHEGGKVTLSLDADEDWVQSHQEQLSHHLSDHLSTGISVTVDVEPANAPAVQPTSAGEIIVIPAKPDSYGISDYDDGTSDSDSEYDEQGQGDSHYDETDSGYDQDDGDSKYAEKNQDGQTDYGDTSYDTKDGDDDGDSGYNPVQKDDGKSDYQPAKQSKSDSGYDRDDGKSDYNKDDGKSDYEEDDDND